MINSLEVKHLTVAYQGAVILSDISFAVSPGSLVAIVGPNGAGKTTLIKAIVQLVPIVSGVVRIDGCLYKPASGAIAYVAQRSGIDWDFPICVLDLVVMGCYGRLGFMQSVGPAQKAAALDALATVDLLAYADRHIGELSGGQQQRVLLARALMQDARILLLDEPLAGIDVYAEQMMLQVLKNLSMQGKTIIMVHHQVQHVSDYFDVVMLLNRSCLAFGKTADILVPELLQAAYGKQQVPHDMGF